MSLARRSARFRTSRALAAALTLAFVGALALPPARVAFAQSGPSTSANDAKVTTQVSARRVEVGQDLVVQVTALASEGDSPTGPRLDLRGDAEVNGPSVRSELRMFSDGRSFTRQRGITATWTVTPRKVGKLVVGPGSFQWGGRTVKGESIEVEVVPAGSTPTAPRSRGTRPQSPFGLDPFDFFRRPPGWADSPFDDSLLAPAVPEELRVDEAPNPIAFLRQEASPLRVVVGEQVTLRVYVYGGRGPYAAGFAAQPAAPDFLSFPTDADDIVPHRVPIGEQVFFAAKLREVALVPLRAGQLTISGARVALTGRGYPASGASGAYLIEAKPLIVSVVEPPIAGRPPGYTIGDVGSFSLSAEVEPRTVEQGGMLAVTARLGGTGNVPSHLVVPEQRGVDWLEPSVRGEVEPRGTAIGGERVFRWTVRLTEPGAVNLGELTLPFYDPDKKRYEVARAALGRVTVKPAPGAAPQGDSNAPDTVPKDDEPSYIEPRRTLARVEPPAELLTDHRAFWWALVAFPLAVPVLAGLARVFGALAERARRRELRGPARVRSLLAEARRNAHGDRGKAAADYERALYEAIEQGTGLKARGVLRQELSARLGRAGVDSARSESIARAVAELEALRFTGEGDLDTLGTEIERLALGFVTGKPKRSRAGGAS